MITGIDTVAMSQLLTLDEANLCELQPLCCQSTQSCPSTELPGEKLMLHIPQSQLILLLLLLIEDLDIHHLLAYVRT